MCTSLHKGSKILNNLQVTTNLASVLTTLPIPLLAEHLYRPASSLDTSVNLRDKVLFSLTKLSIISTASSSRLHVITDTGLLDTMQLRDADNVSWTWISAVEIVGASAQHK